MDEFKTGAFDLENHDQIGLQTPTVFEKNVFYYTFKLETGSKPGGCLGAEGRHLFFVNAKKGLSNKPFCS